MSTENKKYLLIAAAVIIAVIGYSIFRNKTEEWELNLDKTKKNAYGTFITYELLKEKFKPKGFIEIDNSIIESFRKLKKNKTYNYIFINYAHYYDSTTLDTICRFTAAGNTTFIGTEEMYDNFIDTILKQTYHLNVESGFNIKYNQISKDSTLANADIDSIIGRNNTSTFNFLNKNLTDKNGYTYFLKYEGDTILKYFYRFDSLPNTEWNQPIPTDDAIQFAGTEQSYGSGFNFAVLKHGKGQFVILLSAIPFTNYFMRTKKGLEYAEKIFAHLPYQTTLWDNVSQKYKAEDLQEKFHGNSSFGESPLYFILENKALRWAWYLILFGLFIYAIFHAKRRQNIIPIIEPKENNSLKYVETIGQLYYNEEEHIEIANEMRLQFMNFIRQKYHIKTNETDEDFLKFVSTKSGIDEEKIIAIFKSFETILNEKNINQQKLHQLNNQLEYFYKSCK